MSHKNFTIRVDDKETYCGNHYCDGHLSKEAVCDCGKVLCRSEQLRYEDAKILHLQHRLDEAGL